MSARHRQAERRRREAKLLTEALLREAGSVAAAVIEAKLPAPPGAVALRTTADPAGGLINALEEKLGGPVELVETSWGRKGSSRS